MKKEKTIIGRWDRIDLPKMGLLDVHAKIDTGAYTSSIHCSVIELVERDGKTVVHFILLDPDHPAYNGKSFYAEKFKQKSIKSSSGVAEERFIIDADVLAFDELREVEFSLSYRGNLKFPILLGRKFLKNYYLVDVSRTELSYHLKNQKL